MKPIFYAYLITVIVLSGCSSGKATFERGNYYEAVITSVNRLRKNSDHKKSVETLRQAYPMAVTFFEDRAKTALASTERFKWTEVVKSYTSINVMHDEIKRCPGALAVIPNPVNYFSKLQEARQNAAEEHYAAGILALQGKTRESAKQAYGHFKTTNEYVQGYKEVNDYLQAALAAATVKIVVEPIPVHSKTVGVSAEFFNDKISEFVHSAPISEFVKFYSRAEAQKMKLNPDHIIQLQFDDFTVGEIYKHEKEIQLSKDSVVMGTYVSASSGKNETAVNRNALVASGSDTPVNTNKTTTTPVNNQTSDADRERAAKELAEKRRLEQEQAERAQAERLRAEKEAAERERMAKQSEAERAAKEAAEKAAAEKLKSEQEAAEKERLAKQNAEAAQKAVADQLKAEKEAAEREAATKAENERLAKEADDKALAEKTRADKEAAEKALAEKARADKEKADKEKSEKEKADKEKAEKEKADKERVEKEAYVDHTIKREDTLNVTDPVLICHIPPGNRMNTRTLKINRSALAAHLAHGDSEGDCDTNKKNQDGKPGGNEKGKPAEDQKGKPSDDKKGKGPGGSAGLDNGELNSLRFSANEVFLASNDNDPMSVVRYLDPVSVKGDTNKVYGTVKATLYHYTKMTTSKGVVSFKIIDARTGALLAVEKMPGEFVWKSEWATFNGDERALSPDQLKLTKQKELPAPAAQELFIEFTRPIYDQITSKIREFYKGY